MRLDSYMTTHKMTSNQIRPSWKSGQYIALLSLCRGQLVFTPCACYGADCLDRKTGTTTTVFDKSNALYCSHRMKRFLSIIRKQFFKLNRLSKLFENVNLDDVLSFLKEGCSKESMPILLGL